MRYILALACVLFLPAYAAAQTSAPIVTFGSSTVNLRWDREEIPNEYRVYVSNCTIAATVTCVWLPFIPVTPACATNAVPKAICDVPLAALKMELGLHEIRVGHVYNAVEGPVERTADLSMRVRMLVGLEPKNLNIVVAPLKLTENAPESHDAAVGE
jgi:hypothetical protein